MRFDWMQGKSADYFILWYEFEVPHQEIRHIVNLERFNLVSIE
jgi:hypothetical protein